MLNRTLSANLNGLNLGTRNLANLAGLNIVVATPCVRHDHPRKRWDSMRGEDAKGMGGSSISIRGSFPIPISPSSSSPLGSPFWPYPASSSERPARFEVVAVVPVPVEPSVSATAAVRAPRPGASQVQAQARLRGRARETMTRTESIPVASTATGG